MTAFPAKMQKQQAMWAISCKHKQQSIPDSNKWHDSVKYNPFYNVCQELFIRVK